MRKEDLSGVMDLAQSAHAKLYERQAVFADRLLLFPSGSLVLSSGTNIEGYAISHPILKNQPPTLNAMLVALPHNADSYYLHDFVVATSCRGNGYATAGVKRILDVAKVFPATSLIAVYESKCFWKRFGFEPSRTAPASRTV